MQLSILVNSFEVEGLQQERGTPAGLDDGCDWLGVKWVVYERILSSKHCGFGTGWDFDF